MKKSFAMLMVVVMFCTLSACGSVTGISPTAEQFKPETEIPDERDADSIEYSIWRLNGSIRVPKEYYVFEENKDFTFQMCADIGVSTEDMERKISMLPGKTKCIFCKTQTEDRFNCLL